MSVDQIILPSAQALLTCFCNELAANPNPPALCCFRIGSDPVAAEFDNRTGTDWCCEGLAYVRIMRRFPGGAQFPIADELASDCMPAAWGVDMEMGAFRCAPDGVGELDCSSWLRSFTNVQNDQQAMADAICCWIADQKANNPFWMNYMVRDWQPFALQGGCTGGAMIVQAQFQACENCD